MLANELRMLLWAECQQRFTWLYLLAWWRD